MDSVMGGVSEASLWKSDEGWLGFEGQLSMENNGGFAMMRGHIGTQMRDYDGLHISARTTDDTRVFYATVQRNRETGVMWQYPLELSTEWKSFHIPLEKFRFQFMGFEAMWLPTPLGGAVRDVGMIIFDKNTDKFEVHIQTYEQLDMDSVEDHYHYDGDHHNDKEDHDKEDHDGEDHDEEDHDKEDHDKEDHDDEHDEEDNDEEVDEAEEAADDVDDEVEGNDEVAEAEDDGLAEADFDYAEAADDYEAEAEDADEGEDEDDDEAEVEAAGEAVAEGDEEAEVGEDTEEESEDANDALLEIDAL